ncbi:hypothetical protein DIZ27_40440 [Streptomyces sp. NWU339]|uniref:DUF1275 family protein n=1 Tax=Streptomyces sp. NWU339 TaxID=2185284 RepID=UPI000D67B63C|nr:DUF1275 family protein [Streptomyces sp. NWU339]PWI05249.1 hypothetical protein DIZ27_40440 [Streptomyces sp. NWU339]
MPPRYEGRLTAWLTRQRTDVDAHWPPPVMFCLVGEAVVLAAGAGLWAAAGGSPGRTVRDALQFGAAVTMGIQAAAMVAAGRAAAPTTYLTGTLATYIVKGVGASRPDRWVPVRLGALMVGAGAPGVLLRTVLVYALIVALFRCAGERAWPTSTRSIS